MRKPTPMPSLLEGIMMALMLAITGSVLASIAGVVLPSTLALRLLLPILGFIYLCYLLRRARARNGRLVCGLGWILLSAAVLSIDPPLVFHAFAQLALIWLVRSLYFHKGPLIALADLILSCAAGLAWVAAAQQTGSVFISLWSLFLVQACFVTLANLLDLNTQPKEPDSTDDFTRAQRSAEAALKRITDI